MGWERRLEHHPLKQDTPKTDALLALDAVSILDIRAGCAAYPKATFPKIAPHMICPSALTLRRTALPV